VPSHSILGAKFGRDRAAESADPTPPYAFDELTPSPEEETKVKISVRGWVCAAGAVILASFALFLSGCAGLVNAGGTNSQLHAAIQVNPASLIFGATVVGKKVAQTISVANTGSMAVNVGQVNISNSQFSISGLVMPLSLPAGQASSFQVWFDPNSSGTITGTMTVTTDAGVSSEAVALSGTATPAPQQINVTPASLNLGTIAVGGTGRGTVTIGNTGGSNLTVSVINVSAGPFGVSGVATPSTIIAGASATLYVTYSPTMAGANSGSITITSNDPQSPASTIALSGTATVGMVAPTITAQPVNQTVTAGQTATFTVAAGGTAPLSYQWQKSGVNIAGANAASYTTPVTATSDSGSAFDVVVSNTAGSVTSAAATLTVNAATVAPTITTQPVNQTVTAGQTATFTVAAGGTAPLKYQWQKNGVNIAGATATSYTTPVTATPDSGSAFDVVVSNTAGSVTSAAVTLTVNAAPVAPTIKTQPVNQTVTAGQTATFTVAAGGTAPLKYQWRKNGVNIAGATATSYTTPVTATSDSGSAFDVVVSNTAGSVTSAAATLTVNAAAAPAIQLSSSSISFGNDVIGSNSSQVLIITNTGTATLTISQINETGSAFSASGFSLPVSVNAGQHTAINVAFQPTAVGAASGNISIVSNAPSSPTPVSLTGSGIAAILTLSINPTSLSFGNITTATSSAPQTVTISNTGNSNVTITQITLSGAGYSMSGGSAPITLSPSQNLILSVQFSPALAGPASGSISIVSNSNGSPASVPLSGTGVAPVQHSATLSWNASTSTASGYNVYRSTVSGSQYVKLNSSLISGLTYVDSTVQSGTTYYFVTTAVDSAGNESAYSNEVSAPVP